MNKKKSFCHILCYHILFYLIFTASLCIFISGCAAPPRPDTDPFYDKKALALAKQIKSFNQHIIAARGTGWAKVKTDTKHAKFKIAWAAVYPNKLRITFLISANPIETIIATGEKITFISHTGQHFKYSYNSKDPDMERYIKVPIKMSEMILLLLGRFPANNFNDTYFAPSDPSLSTIVLKQNSNNLIQFFHFDNKKSCNSMWKENYNENLIYKIIIQKYKRYGSDNIPVQLIIKDDNNKKLFLEITSFIVNPPIKESVFQLTE